MTYVSFECLKYKFLLFLLCFLCYVKNNKIRTFWVWKLSRNKNIEPHQNTAVSYKKSFIVITKFMSSVHIWGVINLLLISLIFLKIIKKKYDSSAELLVRISVIKRSLYILLAYCFLLSFSSYFSFFFLFFCLFFSTCDQRDSFYRFFIIAFQVLLKTQVKIEIKWFPVWKLFKLFLNPIIY